MMEKTTRKGSSGKSENERTFHVSIKFSFRQKLCCTFPPLSSCDPTVFSCRQQHVRGALPFSLLFLPRFCMTLPVFFFWGRIWGVGEGVFLRPPSFGLTVPLPLLLSFGGFAAAAATAQSDSDTHSSLPSYLGAGFTKQEKPNIFGTSCIPSLYSLVYGYSNLAKSLGEIVESGIFF